jgi:hypothetical protein
VRWLTVLVHLAGAALLALVAWRAWSHAAGRLRFGDMTNMMRIPKYPFQFAVAISLGLFALVLLLEAAKALAPARKDRKTDAMTPTLAGLSGFVALFALLALRMPIGLAMMLVGAVGIAVLNSPTAALNVMGAFPYSYSAVFSLSVIPLFVLMGAFATVSGMGADLYRTAYAGSGTGAGGWPRPRSWPARGSRRCRGRPSRRRRPWARSPCPRWSATATTRGLRPGRSRRGARWAS